MSPEMKLSLSSRDWDRRAAARFSRLNQMAANPDDVDVIVIGGGVSGLAAARELSRANRSVILLEARPRLGGRIHTVRPRDWPMPVELGAEFIHGGNPDL